MRSLSVVPKCANLSAAVRAVVYNIQSLAVTNRRPMCASSSVVDNFFGMWSVPSATPSVMEKIPA